MPEYPRTALIAKPTGSQIRHAFWVGQSHFGAVELPVTETEHSTEGYPG